MERWYAARVRPGFGQMDVAQRNLTRQGLRFSVPRGRRTCGSFTPPLFAGYIFVAFDVDLDDWTPIRSTLGISGILPVGCERPAPLPVGFVEDVSAACERGDYDERIIQEIVERYVSGQALSIVSGSFVGHTGRFVKRNHGAVDLLLYILGRETAVSVPARMVARA